MNNTMKEDLVSHSDTFDFSSVAPEIPAPNWNLDSIVGDLRKLREAWRVATRREVGQRELPSREVVQHLVEGLCGALFPMRLGPSDLREESEDFYVGYTLDRVLNELLQQIRLELFYQARHQVGDHDASQVDSRARDIVRQFARTLPDIRKILDSDVLAAFRGDPAARTVDEVLICYPGITAIIHHRLAHELYRLGVPLLARVVSELAHSSTGIDIHPGAQIGGSFFIDHGTGVVIGETAIIGERVRIYQAVTLGAKSFPVDETGLLHKGQLRHPIVEDDVVIYAGATVLGRITIGRGSVIGGNVWLTRSVLPGSNITQANAGQRTANGEDAPKDEHANG